MSDYSCRRLKWMGQTQCVSREKPVVTTDLFQITFVMELTQRT